MWLKKRKREAWWCNCGDAQSRSRIDVGSQQCYGPSPLGSQQARRPAVMFAREEHGDFLQRVSQAEEDYFRSLVSCSCIKNGGRTGANLEQGAPIVYDPTFVPRGLQRARTGPQQPDTGSRLSGAPTNPAGPSTTSSAASATPGRSATPSSSQAPDRTPATNKAPTARAGSSGSVVAHYRLLHWKGLAARVLLWLFVCYQADTLYRPAAHRPCTVLGRK